MLVHLGDNRDIKGTAWSAFESVCVGRGGGGGARSWYLKELCKLLSL